MMFIKKDGPPLIMVVYVDGRAEIYLPTPLRVRERILSHMLVKSLRKSEGVKHLNPGRYHFNYTKVGALSLEAELEPEPTE